MVVVTTIVAVAVIIACEVGLVDQGAGGRVGYEVRGRLRAAHGMPFRMVVELVTH